MQAAVFARWAVYLPLAIPGIAALAARPLAHRLPPRPATWLLAGSALALAVASSAVLGILALAAAIRIPFVASLGHMSARAISQGDPASTPVAIIAAALLGYAVFAAGRALLRRATAIAAAGRRARDLPGAGQVVVTEDETADAYTLPGWPCRIVVTAGMLRALNAGEREVLLAHERTHASAAHYLFTAVARLAAAANPLLRPVATAVGYTVERWADESAATATGDRALAARAIARAALATKAAPPRREALAGRDGPALAMVLGVVSLSRPGSGGARPSGTGARWVRARGAGPVPRRVAALLRPPPRLSPLLVGAAVALVVASGAATLEAIATMHQFVEYAQSVN
ncbi:MAG TPA: M48 family metalloprotease [Trebonia sp.]|jgi:Zn-dependent protease with chaperone function|nr:M48 family metalloprotease [Trebonia sp.]